MANVPLGEALDTAAVVVGVGWRAPIASRYRKIRSGRIGLPDLALALVVAPGPAEDCRRAALWRQGTVTAAATALDRSGPTNCSLLDRLPLGESGWARNVVSDELSAFLDEEVASCE